MNILFYTTYQVASQKGGTERVTIRTSHALINKGHRCFSSYSKPISDQYELAPFEDCICVKDVNELKSFILKNKIQVVILQGITDVSKLFIECKMSLSCHLKVISAYHFSPGAEKYMFSFYNIRKKYNVCECSLTCKIKAIIQILTYPIYYPWKMNQAHKLYKFVYDNSDKVVLLSKNFIPEFMAFGKINNPQNLEVIPNSLSFNEFANEDMINKKKKRVLVVSRLEEVQKRVSLAIKIWSEIEKDGGLDDWSLQIIGTGESQGEYEHLVKELKLKHVTFEGLKDPRPYYREGAILMMTSKYEGWGLTLTEAQQYGCIPIAFNSYSSLTDIINSGHDGIIVENDNISAFVKKMKELMKDQRRAENMMNNAVESSKRFEVQKIGEKWAKIVDSL